MATGIKGKFPVVHRVVFELRYRAGFTYLDRCGRMINLIQKNHPEWIFPGDQPNPQGAVLVSTENSARLSVSTTRMDMQLHKKMGDLSLPKSDLTSFSEQIEQITSIVIDQLSLDDFSRIGCRIWHLIPFKERAEARQWLHDLGLVTFSPKIATAFGGEMEDASSAIVILGKDRRFRVGFDIVERTVAMDLGDAIINIPTHTLATEGKKGLNNPRMAAEIKRRQVKRKIEDNPPFAVMIDVDVSQEEPLVVRAGEFVKSSVDQADERLRKAME